MKLKVGQALASTIDATKVIVTRAADGDVVVTCGGAEMLDPAESVTGSVGEPQEGQAGETVLGKRYMDEISGVELLCTSAGKGALAVDGNILVVKTAKPLPSSD